VAHIDSQDSSVFKISLEATFPLEQAMHSRPSKISFSKQSVYFITRSLVRDLELPPKTKKFLFQLKLANFIIPGITVEFEEFPISGILIPFWTVALPEFEANDGPLRSSQALSGRK
jgi:hypothetical protein